MTLRYDGETLPLADGKHTVTTGSYGGIAMVRLMGSSLGYACGATRRHRATRDTAVTARPVVTWAGVPSGRVSRSTGPVVCACHSDGERRGERGSHLRVPHVTTVNGTALGPRVRVAHVTTGVGAPQPGCGSRL